MLFKPLPQNLDFFLLQDHLFQTLKKNTLTQKLINQRAQQIVKSLLKDSLEAQITHKYHQTCSKLQSTEKNCQRLKKQLQKTIQKEQKRKKNLIKGMKSEYENILIKTNNQLQTKDQQFAILEEQISHLEESYAQLKSEYQNIFQENLQKSQEIQNLSKENQSLKMKNNQQTKQLIDFQQKQKIEVEKIIFSHQQQMNKNFSKIKILNNSLLQSQTQTKQLQTQNNALKKLLQEKESLDSQRGFKHENQLKKSNKQIQKLKRQLNQSEQNYSILKKQISKFKDKYKQFQQEYNSMKLSHELEEKQSTQKISIQQKDLRSLQIKIHEYTIKNQKLSARNKKSEKALQKLKKYLSTSLVTLKQQNLTLKSFLNQNFYLIKEYSETSVMKVVNHLSSELSSYFQECVYEIKKSREEKNLARQEVKIKTQLIEHLDKMLDSETKSVYDLRYELKHKIKEEEKLRKKLKTHYQQTDKKLEQFQSKYISILKNDF